MVSWTLIDKTNSERSPIAQRYGESKPILHPALGRIDVDAQVLFTENRARTALRIKPVGVPPPSRPPPPTPTVTN